jgi:hypothetical protein
MERMTNNDALPGTDTVYIIVDGATMVGRFGGNDGADTTIVYYRDLNGRNRFVRRANASVFRTAHEAGEALDAHAGYFHVGDRVLVLKGTNTNDSVRENVPAEVVGCRGMIVVVNRTDPGRFLGEGLWAFTSDLRPVD